MTFTLLAIDRSSGLLGAGTASLSLAVGNSVLAIDPAVGAVASQAWTNRALRRRVLDAIRDGASVDEAIDAVPEWDDGHALRQVAVIDIEGRIASRTGAECGAWAGERRGDDHVAIGNVLTGEDVVEALSDGFRAAAPRGDGAAPEIVFAERILSGLIAAERAGGDRRGRQSAAVAIAAIDRDAGLPADLVVDLRADDSVDPLSELARLLDLRAAHDGAPAVTPRRG
ncbi:putative Ntn-hydrolase superfamily protein [Labedella gwakjiensis]|uniref:DUF1028 domain-containing protein n=1 Tax=Labedella gwakjiensis TaxID=390269 RepID=A0A2P8GVE7_9MICO|nr:DUF1028 domain-containing protein [Labedella gwakjiensis]PSL37929.1 putative Ntn-hydrolase superfamily protein [Labedella gwakjiensis]RUQ87505.1 DUF1028 domain-containing protein [Labedella gwakjiensis]